MFPPLLCNIFLRHAVFATNVVDARKDLPGTVPMRAPPCGEESRWETINSAVPVQSHEEQTANIESRGLRLRSVIVTIAWLSLGGVPRAFGDLPLFDRPAASNAS